VVEVEGRGVAKPGASRGSVPAKKPYSEGIDTPSRLKHVEKRCPILQTCGLIDQSGCNCNDHQNNHISWSGIEICQNYYCPCLPPGETFSRSSDVRCLAYLSTFFDQPSHLLPHKPDRICIPDVQRRSDDLTSWFIHDRRKEIQ
jgi:hypothetical protein